MARYFAILIFLFCSACADDDFERTVLDLPSDSNAGIETEQLLRALGSSTPGVLLGHQDDLAYGVKWFAEPGRSDVMETAGKRPAVIGWDLGDLETGSEHSLDNVSFDFMAEEIVAAYDRGSVSTCSWHARNPVTGGDTWDRSGDVISKILPGGSHHDIYNTWLDRVASFFFRVAPVPVLFRPFHEMNGSWFWWGDAPPEAFRELWRYTFDYIHAQGVDNILWVYSQNAPNSGEELSKWYPGDDYVDVVGFDDYESVKTTETSDRFFGRMQLVSEFANRGGKVAALTETGLEGIGSSTWFTEVLLPALQSPGHNIAWALLWRNANEARDRAGHFFAPYPDHESAEDFRRFASDPNVLFEGDLGLSP